MNLTSVNLSLEFNHCTVLIYYAGEHLKKKSSLGYHTDCVYSASNGKYVPKLNSQVENTPALIYSLGNTRTLKRKSRHISKSSTGRSIWKNDKDRTQTFCLGSDTVTIINPLDENPLSVNNIQRKSQYLHGGVSVTGENFSVGLVFRVVKSTCVYNQDNDTMVTDDPNVSNYVVGSCLGIDLNEFHNNLSMLYHKTMF